MSLCINFIIRGPHPSFYSNIMHSIVDPIRLHLPQSIISENARSDAVNIHFFHEKEYREYVSIDTGVSVFMSHGIADKGWRDAPAMRPFDYICIPGPLWKEKLVNNGIEAERILEVGFPKLDPLFQGQVPQISRKDDGKIVLYAPTHSQGPAQYSSYPDIMELLSTFPDSLNIIIAPHPVHKENQMPTFNELLAADVVISDSSSLLYEAWALGKPVVFPDWLVKKAILTYMPQSFTAQIYRENIGYHAQNEDELMDIVNHAIEQGIDKKTHDFIEGYFPSALRGKSGKICAAQLEMLSTVNVIPGRGNQ